MGFFAEHLTTVIIIAVIIVILLILMIAGYVKAPTDKAFIISGIKRKPRILIGKAGIKLPFFERKDELTLKQISIDIKTNGYIPTRDFIGVDIDAVAKVRVLTYKDVNPEKGITEEMANAAMKNFLNQKEDQIRAQLTDSLQGNMREIIGTQTLKNLCQDRKTFGDEVQSKAQKDMNALGIWIESCNIQKIEDENNLINALGQDNMSQIQKDASIAKAQADRDVAVAKAEASKAANDAQVAAETEIAERQNELAIKKADLKKAADIKQAEADAAYRIQEQEQRRSIEVANTNADIAKQEREVELKQREAEVREQALDAEVKKKADADLYRRQKDAEAALYEQQRIAEAKLIEKQKEAEGIAAVGKAEADAIRAKGLAEAEALEKKAEAMKKYGQAAMMEMIVKALPDMAAAIAGPLETIDKVTIIDGGGQGSGVGSMGAYVPEVLAKTIEAVKETTGVDIREIMKAETYDAKVKKEISVTGLEGVAKNSTIQIVAPNNGEAVSETVPEAEAEETGEEEATEKE